MATRGAARAVVLHGSWSASAWPQPMRFAAFCSGAACSSTLSKVLRRAARCCTSSGTLLRCADRSWFSLGYAFGGIGAHLQRVGAFEGHRFGSGMPPPAPLVPMCVTTHGRTVCFDAYYEARQCFLYWIAHAHASYPRELAHISLTALARSAQCTGFYAWILDALLRGGAMTILTVMLARSTISRYVTHAHVGYTQNLKSVA